MTNKNENIVEMDFASLSANNEELNYSVPSSMTEEFRSIKRAILKVAFATEPGQKNKNRIMITSVNRGEGKSFISANLAQAASLETGIQTLLVDVNVQNPTLSSIASTNSDIGLIDFLSDATGEIQDYIFTTNRNRLKFLAVGNNNYLANELLGGDKMTTLMRELNTRYDDRLVILDCPHIAGVNETLAIAKHADQILVVVEEGKTTVNDLKKTVSLLPEGIAIHYLVNRTLQVKVWNT